jgi:acyl-CoA dehydrogenase
MFLVDGDNPGMQAARHIETLDESLYGGHPGSAAVLG